MTQSDTRRQQILQWLAQAPAHGQGVALPRLRGQCGCDGAADRPGARRQVAYFQRNVDNSSEWQIQPRIFVPFGLSRGWTFTQRIDLPVSYTDQNGTDNPTGTWKAGIGEWTPATRALLKQGDLERGAALATACNNCHGANGVSTDAAIPNLAGHSVAAIYKQLEDFKSNKRNAMVMGVFVAPLSQQQMLDLAAHYAALPNPLAPSAKADSVDASAKALAEVGAPLRGIASCAACHGPLGQTPGAPGLRGQQRAYLEQQLRNVARQLSDDEIAGLAAYYSGLVQ